jgi:hypothetical protein
MPAVPATAAETRPQALLILPESSKEGKMKVRKYQVGDRVVLRRWHGRTKARAGTVVSVRPWLDGGDIIVQRDGLRSRERWSTYFWRKAKRLLPRIAWR